MSVLYNYSAVQAGSFGGWFTFANTVTNDLFMSLVTIAIFVILLIILLKNGADVVKGLMAVSWTMFIFSTIAWFGGWLNWAFAAGFLVLAAGLLFYQTLSAPTY